MSNAYCTITQLKVFFDERIVGQLSSDTGTADPNAVKAQTLLDAAASELESYLSGRYALPLATVPPILTRWVACKTVELMYGRRANLPQEVKADVDWADAWIEKLSMRKVSLPGISAALVPVLKSSEQLDSSSRFDNVPFFDNTKQTQRQ